MKNILVPIDFSGNSLNALEYALRFFGKSQCNFHLLHVITKTGLVNTEDVFGHQENVVSVVPANATKEKFQQTLQWIKETLPTNEKHSFITIVDNNAIINSIRKQVIEKKNRPYCYRYQRHFWFKLICNRQHGRKHHNKGKMHGNCGTRKSKVRGA